MTTITFIGAGSTVFTKNIAGDILQRPALAGAEIRLMDINPQRLEESEIVVGKMAQTLGGTATVKTYRDQRAALDGADFVVVALPDRRLRALHRHRLRGAEEVRPAPDHRRHPRDRRHHARAPHRAAPLVDLRGHACRSARSAIMLQYVNPMAINTWAIAAKYPEIRQVGLCHSVQGTAVELARDLDIPVEEIRYRAAGINHMAFYLNFEHRQPDGSYRDLYPALRQGYREGRFPKPSTGTRAARTRCATRC